MNKICTDLEQSKKLAEILPLESADMYWRSLDINGHISWSSHIKRLEPPIYDLEHYIPCWSLAALLDIIPNWTMDKTDKINLACNPYYHCEVGYDDSVDAAFETICWLKENNAI